MKKKSDGAAGWGVIAPSTDLSDSDVAFKSGVELLMSHTYTVCVGVCREVLQEVKENPAPH